jgi:mannose-6-phosphate isomerase-like protein (cupin superfamily)
MKLSSVFKERAGPSSAPEGIPAALDAAVTGPADLQSIGPGRSSKTMNRRGPTLVNLSEKLEQFSERWAPKIVARYNDNEVRLVKAQGELVWHKHDETDELFLILEGEFDMQFRDQTITVLPGEILIVPRGVEHRPTAPRGEVKLVLIDPNGTPNTGDDATATHAVEL